jgi:hypothetical protein
MMERRKSRIWMSILRARGRGRLRNRGLLRLFLSCWTRFWGCRMEGMGGKTIMSFVGFHRQKISREWIPRRYLLVSTGKAQADGYTQGELYVRLSQYQKYQVHHHVEKERFQSSRICINQRTYLTLLNSLSQKNPTSHPIPLWYAPSAQCKSIKFKRHSTK